MDRKTTAIISYITIIGWLIAYFQYKDKTKDAFVNYHLKQSLGISIISILLGLVLNIVVIAVPALAVLTYANIFILILWILGIVNASKEEMKPVPVVGSIFEQKFSFLD
ncbi:DUF4870 domain-containing protein [Sphingobacterium spiritivorum]|uniref:DUF4870 domain-containing protein n=1 Tax=Sphingobacterium TaxID=28453 RepID=UPI00191AD61B|nr:MULTISPECIES: DUF4870 domain-containing protein [Sphingobacterium]QQT24733.1 DUF4870 domain-containing protein [Sphingobacterium spiritivorum]